MQARFMLCNHCHRYSWATLEESGEWVCQQCGRNPKAQYCRRCRDELMGLERIFCSICAASGNHADTAFGRSVVSGGV